MILDCCWSFLLINDCFGSLITSASVLAQGNCLCPYFSNFPYAPRRMLNSGTTSLAVEWLLPNEFMAARRRSLNVPCHIRHTAPHDWLV